MIFELLKQYKKQIKISLIIIVALVINLYVPMRLFSWGVQDLYDPAEIPPENPMRPFYRILFAGVATALIYGVEALVLKARFGGGNR